MSVADERQVSTGVSQRHRQRQPRHGRRLGHGHDARPLRQALGQDLHARESRCDDEVLERLSSTAHAGPANNDMVVGDDSCVDADCDRVGSLEWHEGPPFVVAHLGSSVRAHRRTHGYVREDPRARSRPWIRAPEPLKSGGATAQVTHACRSSDAPDTTAGSRRDRTPSIPSIESTREQSPGDDLFHEPEAQPKFVTAEAPSRDHPTWPPLRWEGLPLLIQAR